MNKLLFAISFIIVVILTGCSPIFYSPNTQNVPFIEKKGAGNISVSGNGNRIELQGSYGISDRIGIQLNGGVYIPKDLDNGNGGSGNFVEGGVGYFKSFNNRFVFEAYGIIGYGSIENHLPSTIIANPQTLGDLSANLLRIGIQPSIGYKSTYFDVAVSSRFANLKYSNIKGDLVFENVNQVSYLNDNNSSFVIEPALTLRGGIEKIKLQLQIGFSLNVSESDFRQDKSFGAIGINYNFN